MVVPRFLAPVMTSVSTMAAMRARRVRVRVRLVALVDPKHALDAADNAADRGADHGADGAGDTISFMKSVRRASRYALAVGRQGKSKRSCD
jgi:hypothetical protein